MNATMTQLSTGTQPVLIMGGAALATLALFWGVALVVSRALDPARRRLEQLEGGTAAKEGLGTQLERLIRPYARFLLPRGAEQDKTRRDLQYAGYRSNTAVTTFYGVKLGLAAGLFLLWLVASRFMPNLTMGRIAFIGLAIAFLGTLLPGMWLDRQVKNRHQRLRNGFPDALDLLTVCVESGLGLAHALQRVSDELEVSHPELAMEIATVTAQMRAGVDRETALQGLSTRTGLDDIRGLVGLLIQTLRFGTGIADALRVYSEEFRDKRMQRAEEAAAKVGTKLIFPLVFCLFPSFFVVAIGPAVIRLVEVFSGK